MQIHQFSPSCGRGDGVSNGMFFTRTLLREMGFDSSIYCDLVQDEVRDEVLHMSQLNLADGDILLVHHSLGYENCAWFNDIRARKVLVYHNITPPQFLPDNGLPELSMLGTKQLALWAGDFQAAIGDSELNSKELRAARYAHVATIPLLVDVTRWQQQSCNPVLMNNLRGAHNILFVGRLCEHKHQLQLLDMFEVLRHLSRQPVRLILAGGVTSLPYEQQVRERIHQLKLEDQVLMTGKISDTDLITLYRSADAYVSLSEHEGFGMPLIEAMLHDVPVIARATEGVSATMGGAGILLDADVSPATCAAHVQMLLTEPALRRRTIAAQRENVQRFSRQHIKAALQDFLQSMGVQVPHAVDVTAQATDIQTVRWQMEGPFDSSYSLAIVNRELALALKAKEGAAPLALRSREGHGDFPTSAEFLSANPEIAAMQEVMQQATSLPDVVLRNCYPPTLDDMQTRVRVVHSYGWEETGFPAEFVNEFNRKLDLILVVSRFVGKVLRDSGVRVPIAAVGNGVDHLLRVAAGTVPARLLSGLKTYRFLHVSSCFPRKGADALLAAYGQAFRDRDDVSLVIKTFPNPHNDVEQQLARLQAADADFPHVQIIMDDYDQAQMRALYEACHAVVAPSRGEGFGLPVAEAMLLKLPVIATAWSGQMDFCDDSKVWLCDYRFAKSTSHFSATHSAWADPDIDHLALLMKEVHGSTPEVITARTAKAYRFISENYAWTNVADRSMQAIAALEQQPLLRKEPRIGWISSWNARCGIASYSAFLTAGMPRERLVYLSSHISERTARDAGNVVRSWEASMDETLDYAYLEIEEQKLDAIVIQYNFGFFSLATLARLIRRLKADQKAVYVFFHSTADIQRDDNLISLASIAEELQLADRLFVHGIDDMNRLKGFGVQDNLVFFPQGLMPTLDNASSRLDSGQLQRLTGKKVIAAYGFLLPHKGIQALINAFALLPKELGPYHLLLVTSLYPVGLSEGEYHLCRKLVNDLGLADHVTFLSDYLTDEESQSWLQQADLIVYPYQQTQESSSAAVRMGLASARPVAVTPLSIFDDVKDAVHVLPGTDAAAIAEGILAILNSPQALQEKTIQAKAWTATRQWPALSQRLLNTIDGIANSLDMDIGRL
ncbi:glycosyltransferase [Undibacterium sp. TS12]|uniref:glycosyltransferase n=1 Tax=Undibacterium sp. TS12 TaxID=2908202 RepID=UPI001F4D1531|nr:glycosyltransferase [Undibacterium sp. TS12]MCH8621923.1 glycosyltransferase [Undibacterium sp. TS12]